MKQIVILLLLLFSFSFLNAQNKKEIDLIKKELFLSLDEAVKVRNDLIKMLKTAPNRNMKKLYQINIDALEIEIEKMRYYLDALKAKKEDGFG